MYYDNLKLNFNKKAFEVSHKYINETLSIYLDDFIFLDNAFFNDGELTGSFVLKHYPFTKSNYLNYVTSSMYMLFISQLGYVYVRILCENNTFPKSLNIDTQKFFDLRDSGNIVFVDFNKIKFREKVFIDQGKLILSMKFERFLYSKNIVVIEGNIYTENNEFKARSKVALLF